jgi:hypothetical protein
MKTRGIFKWKENIFGRNQWDCYLCGECVGSIFKDENTGKFIAYTNCPKGKAGYVKSSYMKAVIHIEHKVTIWVNRIVRATQKIQNKP